MWVANLLLFISVHVCVGGAGGGGVIKLTAYTLQKMISTHIFILKLWFLRKQQRKTSNYEVINLWIHWIITNINYRWKWSSIIYMTGMSTPFWELLPTSTLDVLRSWKGGYKANSAVVLTVNSAQIAVNLLFLLALLFLSVLLAQSKISWLCYTRNILANNAMSI